MVFCINDLYFLIFIDSCTLDNLALTHAIDLIVNHFRMQNYLHLNVRGNENRRSKIFLM